MWELSELSKVKHVMFIQKYLYKDEPVITRDITIRKWYVCKCIAFKESDRCHETGKWHFINIP